MNLLAHAIALIICAVVVLTAGLWLAAAPRLSEDAYPFKVYLTGVAILTVIQVVMGYAHLQASWIPLAAASAQMVLLAPVMRRWVASSCLWILPLLAIAFVGFMFWGLRPEAATAMLDGITALLGIWVFQRSPSWNLKASVGLALFLVCAPAALLWPMIPIFMPDYMLFAQMLWIMRDLLLVGGYFLLARYAWILLWGVYAER